MTQRDGRMRWIRCFELLDSDVQRRTVEVELASEAAIGGLLVYAGEALLVAPLTMQSDSAGLNKFRMRIQFPSTPFEYQRGTQKGYLFRDGPVGELVALLSLHFEARFYVQSIVDGELTPHSLASKTEYSSVRAAIGRTVDPTLFDARKRTFAGGLAAFLDEVRRLPTLHHQALILAASHYLRALREVGVDEEMVFVRLVSAIESIARDEPIPDDALVGRNLESLLRVEDLSLDQSAELKRTFEVRRTKARFLAFLVRHSTGFFSEQPSGPPGTQVTPANLRDVASAVYNARSNYLHVGDPMYLSQMVAPFPEWHMDPSVGMQWDDRVFRERDKLPRADFFHRLVRHCILSHLRELAYQ